MVNWKLFFIILILRRSGSTGCAASSSGPPGSGGELQDWVAFALVCAGALLVVHFFVGWLTLAGGGVLAVSRFLCALEVPQPR